MFGNYKFSNSATKTEPEAQADNSNEVELDPQNPGQLSKELSDQSGDQSIKASTFGKAYEQNQQLQRAEIQEQVPSKKNNIKRKPISFPLEQQHVSTSELFSGFEAREVQYLENKVLFYIREALVSFINQVKSEGGKDWWIDSPTPSFSGERSLNEYTFRSEEDN